MTGHDRAQEAVRVEFAAGRPCLVITDPGVLNQIAWLLERAARQALYRDGEHLPLLGLVCAEARRAAAIGQLVPQREPEHATEDPSAARWLSTAAMATSLGITPRAVRKRIEKNQLPGRMVGGRWVIDLKELKSNAA